MMSQLDKNRKRLLDWLATPFFLLAFIGNLLIFDVLFRIRRIAGMQSGYEMLFQGINRGVLLCLRIFAGMRFRVHGHFEINSCPVLVVSNHQSMFDIPFLCAALPLLKLRFIAKVQLASRIPGISVALRNGEHAVIDRKNPRQAMPEIERVACLMKDSNLSVVIFPEGTRSRDGHLKNFKTGGIARVVETLGQVVLLPVAIRGSWRLAQYSLWPVTFGQTVDCCITAPIPIKAGDSVEQAVETARGQIERAIAA